MDYTEQLLSDLKYIRKQGDDTTNMINPLSRQTIQLHVFKINCHCKLERAHRGPYQLQKR